MAAIVSGASLGLNNSSLAVLGGQGQVGNSNLGASGERVYVNSTTGNLVLQRRDEILVGLGNDVSILRTYNSQGLLDGDNNDNWRIGLYRRVYNLFGTVNTANSTITRVDGDGSELVYRYDTTLGKYINTDGDGAFDSLQYNATNQLWTWTDGSTRITEEYDGASGRITRSLDPDGNAFVYTYNASGLITRVTDASGQITDLAYTGSNLTQITVTSNGQVSSRTRYAYDTSNRLSQVTTDLSPEDSSIADGKTYVVTYTYDGTSKRVASITQTDGNNLSFVYDASGRVASFTDANGKATGISYTQGSASQAMSAPANNQVLSTTENQPASYPLNTSLLTNPAGGWAGATALESSSNAASQLSMGSSNDGKALAAWLQNGSVYASSYDPATHAWSSPVLVSGSFTNISGVQLGVDHQSGNAIVTWIDATANANKVYAARGIRSGATVTWGAAQLLVTTTTGVSVAEASGAINGTGASAVIWRTVSGTTHALSASTFSGSTWAAAVSVASGAVLITTPQIAVTEGGVVQAVWRASNGGAESLLTRGKSGASWAASATLLESTTAPVGLFRIDTDIWGDVNVTWVQGTTIYSSWGKQGTGFNAPQVRVSNVGTVTELAYSDSSGDSVVAWLTSTGDLWAHDWLSGVLQKVTTGAGLAEVAADVDNAGDAVISWRVGSDLYASRFAAGGSAWTAPELLESASGAAAAPRVAVSTSGELVAVWQQSDGTANSIFASRYLGSGGTGTPYYTVLANDGWESIGQRLYGSSTVASALQSALGNPALTQGAQLTGFPTTLSGTAVVTVAAYYTVGNGNTWTSITQNVYGTSDPNAVAALQAALGIPGAVPAAGTHLTMPQQLNYSVSVTGTLSADITDPLNQVTSLFYDGTGQIVRALTPAVGGTRLETRYAYDAKGNVTQVTDGKGNVVTYDYDSRGNRILERDAAGNTITRTYGTNNELLTETSYLIPDPDGAGAGQPGTPLTTRYAYDGENHLRFVVSAEGRVTEHRYDIPGQRIATLEYAGNTYSLAGLNPTDAPSVTTLANWVTGADKTKATRVNYEYDFRGQVKRATTFGQLDSAGEGIVSARADTDYIYDQAGNLLKVTDPRGVATTAVPDDFTTTYVYDGLGRVLSTLDAMGRSTLTTYQDGNRKTVLTFANGLVSTSTYDAVGNVFSVLQSSGGTTLGETKYFYDADRRLRRIEDPTGVTSHILYDEAGRKITGIDGDGSLTEYRYDAAGNLTRTIRYATAVSGTNLALLKDAGGNPTNVTLAAIRPAATADDRSTWNTYDAANRLVKSVDELGFVTEQIYDGAGRLSKVVRYANAVSTSLLGDTPAASAVAPVASTTDDRISRNLYDAEGKLAGTLDAEGYLVEYKYDAAGELVETIGYATVTSAAQQAAGSLAQLRPALSAADVHSYRRYDAQGRLLRQVDGEGYLTEYSYDAAGNRTGETRYAIKATDRALTLTGVSGVYASTPDGPSNSITGDIEFVVKVAPDSWNSGVIQHILAKRNTNNESYAFRIAADGKLVLIKGNATGGPTTWSGTSNSAPTAVAGQAKWLKASIDVDNGAGAAVFAFWESDDGVTWSSLGSTTVAGAASPMFDGSSSLEIGAAFGGTDRPFKGKIYYADVRNGINGPIVAKFDPALDAGGASTTSFKSATGEVWTLNGAASIGTLASAQDQSTSYVYDALNRVTSQTAPDGTVTQYTYDEVGNLTTTVKGNGTDLRTLTTQYDKQGRVTAELSAKGASLLVAGADINAIWAAHAVKYTYDAAGRRTSTTDANGNKTLFYYNADGALTHTINARGEVKASVYNALGQVTSTMEYGTRLSAATLAGLSGGLVNSALNTAIQGIANPALDSKTDYQYNLTGGLSLTRDPLANAVTQAFDAFGEVVSISQGLFTQTYRYDRRGLVRQTFADPSGINASTSTDYDAFGRAIRITDARNNASTRTYDRLGRTVVTTDPLSNKTKVSYDAFDRVLTQTDALGKVTNYSYNTASRSITFTTPEGVATTTTQNRYGETISIRDGRNNTTTYTYDPNGNLIQTDAPAAGSTIRSYDGGNRLTDSIDALGTRTTYTYDAANRVATRTVDYGTGRLNLVTTYDYDPKGQTITVTDPAGVVTKTQFDLNGQTTSVVVDYDTGRLNLTTTYTYDARGKTLTVTEGAGSANPKVTRYDYDVLGRRTAEHVDPNGVNATTSYAYDGNGNVVRKTDALGYVTRYTYDANDRLIHTVDALGGVTKNEYDADGRLIRLAAYFKPISLSGLTDATTTVDLVAGRIVTDGNDRTKSYVYDGDGREVFCIDGLGLVTQKTYDANGNLVRTLEYANAIPVTTALTQAAVTAALSPNANDRLSRTVYDAANRVIFTIDGSGGVTQFVYDNNGQVIRQIAYVTPVTAAFADNTPPPVSGNPYDRTTRFFYDAAGRRTFAIDAEGYVTQRVYDNVGNVTKEVAFANAVQRTVVDGVAPQVVTVAPASGSYVLVDTAHDRVTRSIYDAAGRQRYSVDAEGYVTERRVDALGRETSRVRYFDKVTVADGATTASMALLLPATPPTTAIQEQASYDALGRVLETVDGENIVTHNVYDALGQKTDVIHAYGTSAAVTTHYKFDALGRTLEETQAYGTADAATARYALNAFGERTSIIDPRGVQLAEQNTAWAQSERQRLNYAAQASSLTIVDRAALLALYTSTQVFDNDGRKTASTDALGNATRTVYDARGNAIKITDPRGNSGYFYYGANDKVRFQVDPMGYATEYRYDAFGNVTQELRYASKVSGAYDERTSIDTIAQRITPSALDDRQTTKAYDHLGQVTSITYQATPTSYTETFVYDAFGNKTQHKDKNDAVFNYEYNARGLVTKELSPDADVVTAVLPSVVTQHVRLTKVYEYDAFGRRTRMVEASGLPQQRETRYGYDKLGHEKHVDAPSFSVFDRATGTTSTRTPTTDRVYDLAGNVVMETAPDGRRVLNYYDALDHKVASVDAENALHEYEYDAVGNLIRERTYDTRLTGTLTWQTRPAPVNSDTYREMRYTYNANNLRTDTETRVETLFSYDRLLNLSEGYYDAAVHTSTKYNANGDVVQTTDGNGNSSYQFYDAVGNRILQVDQLGYVIRWDYNSQGQVSREIRYATALPAATFASLTIGADPQALLGTIPGAATVPDNSTNPDDRITEYVYDRLGRVTTERKKGVSFSTIDATSGQKTDQVGDLETRFEYDGNGNVKAVILPGAQGRSDFTYDALGHRTQELKPQFMAFNGRGQALVATREETDWAYDACGNTAVETQLALSAAENRQTRSDYDGAGRLRNEVGPEGAKTAYDYDIAGNVLRSSRQVTDVDGVAHTYRTYFAYDHSNRELSRQDIEDEGTASQVTRETQDTRYNAHGDIEAKGVNGQFQEQYKYDRLGHLFWTNKENGTPRLYVYDGNGNATLELHAINADLSTVTGSSGPIPVTGPAQARLFSPTDVQLTFTRYDARNQVVDVYQPPMEFGALLSMAPIITETGTAGAPAETPLTNLADYHAGPTSQMTQVGPTQTRTSTAGGWTPVSTLPSSTTFGYVTSFPPNNQLSPDVHTATNQVVPLGDLGLTAGTTTVVQPTVVDAPVTVISDDGATKTVIERMTNTTVTTEVTVNTDKTVLKKVTTTVDVINRVTTFKRDTTATYSTSDESLSTQWTLDKSETLDVDRRVDVKQEKITRQLEYDAVNTFVGSAASFKGVLAYSPPAYVSIHSDFEYGWYNDKDNGPQWTTTGYLLEYVNVPAINYYGDDPIVVTDTWENGTRTETQTIGSAGGQLVFHPRHDGHVINIYKAGVWLFSISIDRDWHDPGGWLQPSAMVSIKGQDSRAAKVFFNSREGMRELNPSYATASVTEFTVGTGLNAGDWFEYEVRDSAGQVLNRVSGTIGASHANQYQTAITQRITQKIETITDNTNNYHYEQTADSRLQNNYLRHLAAQLSGVAPAPGVIHRQQAYNAFGEVIEEVDGNLNHTKSKYNDLGKLVRKEDPETNIYPETGASLRARPTTQYYYDELGQLVGTQDANSYLKPAAEQYFSTRALVNGRVEKEFDAFGHSRVHRYDRLGNERLETNEILLDTESQYDKAGRLTRVIRYYEPAGAQPGAQHSYDSFEYDLDGNRIAHTNALGLRETYLYDGEGRIRRQTSFAGRQTAYQYSYLADIGGIGGWEKKTLTAGVSGQDVETDRSDYFGKIRYHQDLGGHEFTYLYNQAGWLKEQNGTTGIAGGRNAQHIVYDYYQNGYLKSVSDSGISSYSLFQYDKNGNRTFEAYSQGPIAPGLQDLTPYQLAEAEYDELNRVKRVHDQTRFDIHYSYDANGNRRSIESTYFDLLANTTQQQNFYYAYDRMNRFVTTMGQLDATGKVVRGTTGYDIEYDWAGRRATVYDDHPDTNGAPQSRKETYTYDPIGTVKETKIKNLLTGTERRTLRQNDAIGRVIDYTEYDVNNNQTRWVHHAYDQDNLPTLEETHDALTPTQYERTEYHYLGNGILSYTVGQAVGAPNTPTVTLTYSYDKWDSYKESLVVISATAPNVNGWKPGSSTYSYDSNGHITRVYDSQASRTLDYINNSQGQVMKRHEVDGVPNPKPVIRRFYTLNGVVIGDVGTDKVPSRVDYAQALADYDQRTLDAYLKKIEADNAGRKGFFRDFIIRTQQADATASLTSSRDIAQRVFPVTSADFDQNYQPINDTYPGLTPGSYVTHDGDSLQSIALAMWGDSSLWYLLADANGLTGSERIPAGTRLTLPNVVTNIHNNAQTFRPYDPGLALGDTTPTLPDPPPPPQKKKKCGGFGAILAIIVLVVATVFTAGVLTMGLSGALGSSFGAIMTVGGTTLAGGFSGIALAAGAVGSIASQGVSMAMGLQDSFSWKQVATSAVGAWATAGIAGAGGAAEALGTGLKGYGALAFNAAASNVVTQGINMAFGVQKKFDWRSVAASAIAAPIAKGLVGDVGPNAEIGDRFASAAARGLIGYAAQRAFGVKADVTNVVANSITDSLISDLKATEEAKFKGGIRAPGSVVSDWGPRFAYERDTPTWSAGSYRAIPTDDANFDPAAGNLGVPPTNPVGPGDFISPNYGDVQGGGFAFKVKDEDPATWVGPRPDSGRAFNSDGRNKAVTGLRNIDGEAGMADREARDARLNDEFMKGYNDPWGRNRSVVDDPATTAETAGKYAGLGMEVLKGLIGYNSAKEANRYWNAGQYDLAAAWGAKSLIEAGTTVFTLGGSVLFRGGLTAEQLAASNAARSTYTSSTYIPGLSTGLESEVAALYRIGANKRLPSLAAERRLAYQQAVGDLDFAHIEGEAFVTSSGKPIAIGGHFSSSPNIRMPEGVWETYPSGVIAGPIQIRTASGEWLWKTNNGDMAFATLTPPEWSVAQAKGEMSRAFLNRYRDPNTLETFGNSGGVKFKFRYEPKVQLWRGFPVK